MNVLSQIEEKIRNFPQMPVICTTLVGQLENPNSSIEELTENMRYDPGLTANILHLANSAYYGASHTISSLHDAVILIGLNKIIQHVMARGIAGYLRRPLQGYGLEPEEMLLHAVWVAVASEQFCKISRHKLPQAIFTSALLHDLGKLVLDEFVLERQDAIKSAMADGRTAHYQAETDVLGINHAEAGSRLLEQWDFPEELVITARLHHTPEEANRYPMSVNIVHLSNTLAHAVGIGAGWVESMAQPAPKVLSALHLTFTDVEYAASQTLDKMQILHKILIS